MTTYQQILPGTCFCGGTLSILHIRINISPEFCGKGKTAGRPGPWGMNKHSSNQSCIGPTRILYVPGRIFFHEPNQPIISHQLPVRPACRPRTLPAAPRSLVTTTHTALNKRPTHRQTQTAPSFVPSVLCGGVRACRVRRT